MLSASISALNATGVLPRGIRILADWLASLSLDHEFMFSIASLILLFDALRILVLLFSYFSEE